MKVRLVFKTPDAVADALSEIPEGQEKDDIKQIIRRFVKWDEIIVVEVDDESGQATVVPQGD
jgi:hypothetical protein